MTEVLMSEANGKSLSARKIAAARRTIVDWFTVQGWKPFRFQRQTWNAMLDGQSGLIHATTGTGKTYAAWLGPVMQSLAGGVSRTASSRRYTEPLTVLWLTPLRALAGDTRKALEAPVSDLGLNWSIETRTGDTASSTRNRQRTRLPTALITTPESLSLFLSHADAAERFAHLQYVIVDEWHELLGTKRGVQTELALARLRKWRPGLQTWGLSATLGNSHEAMSVLLGQPKDTSSAKRLLIRGASQKRQIVDSLIPSTIERFPWAGHLGMRLVSKVVREIDSAATSLVFTNTRSQTEAWYQGLLKARPDWAGKIALHHGSLDRETRDWVEDGLRSGELKSVVCTSSLDLGVDFSPVERVFQVGSPKGVARLLQRAGRSGHSPGRASRITCVPTHAFELVEVAAARDAIESGYLESRPGIQKPLDVLTQHAVTIALGGGFEAEDLFEEIRQTTSYADLSVEEWNWVLDFVSTGGETLKSYPDYHKVTQDRANHYQLDDRRLARQHRMSIGTIVGDTLLTVQFLKGGKLGTIDEQFLAKIKPGERFVFAGRVVELVTIEDSKVWVRLAKSVSASKIPRWMGGRLPLSTQLAQAVRNKLDEAARGIYAGPEMNALRPIFDLQTDWSHIPRQGQLLIERATSREGHHLFFYPFAGRSVHEGLASLFAFRLSREVPITFSMSINDYGIELLSFKEPPLNERTLSKLLSPENLVDDLLASMNASEMARRQFREIAYIAGLVFRGYPHQRKSARQLQASTGLLFDVFQSYDPQNLLLQQAKREVLEHQLEHTRMRVTLEELDSSDIVIQDLGRFSPLCFPLVVDRLRARLSSEKLSDRVRRMQVSLENAADS